MIMQSTQMLNPADEVAVLLILEHRNPCQARLRSDYLKKKLLMWYRMYAIAMRRSLAIQLCHEPAGWNLMTATFPDLLG